MVPAPEAEDTGRPDRARTCPAGHRAVRSSVLPWLSVATSNGSVVAVMALIVCATGVAGCGGDVQTTDAGTSDAAPSADADIREAAPPPTTMGMSEGAPSADADIRTGPPSADADINEAAPPTDAVDAGCDAGGLPCCGTSCNAGNVCVAIGGVSQCQACGQPGQPCCATMPACADTADSCFYRGSLMYCMNNSPGTLGQAGDGCTTTCADPGDTCLSNGMSSYCIACGGLGNPCCGAACGPSLRCMAGTCQ
jgi:hypothetical protein